MRRFRSIPVEIEAVQWTGDVAALHKHFGRLNKDLGGGQIGVFCTQSGGYHLARIGDWIEKKPDGGVVIHPGPTFADKFEPIS